MDIPESLKYSKEHEWVRVDGSVARIGITDHAQDALGDIVFTSLPAVGQNIVAGESCGEVESTKSVSDIYSPLTGTVVEINSALDSNPEAINKEPYGGGWMVRMNVDDPTTYASLLDAAAYEALISDQ